MLTGRDPCIIYASIISLGETQDMQQVRNDYIQRRCFIGGSDARIIMGSDEAALVRLWRRVHERV
jgi:predicted phage-related endonuclease